MATLTISNVKTWLAAANLPAADLTELADLVGKLLMEARETEAHFARCLLELDVISRHAGAKSTRDLLAKLDGFPAKNSAGRVGRVPGKTRGEIRKPYLDYRNPSQLWALPAHAIPPWAAELFAAGWTKKDLHYRNLADALRVRSLPVEHNYEQLYHDLLAAEQEKRGGNE